MGIANVRQYFRDRMDAIGYVEWTDGFNVENIPSTVLDQSYHVESGQISATTANHQPHRFDCPIVLRVFFKGFNDPIRAIDDAYGYAEDILAEVLLPSNRLSNDIHDVQPVSIAVNPLTQQNDNSVILEINFLAITFMRF